MIKKPFYQLSYIPRLKENFSTSYQGIGILSFLAGGIVYLSLGKGTGTCGKNVSMVLGSYLIETDNFLPTSILLFVSFSTESFKYMTRIYVCV